jgi:putative transposase
MKFLCARQRSAQSKKFGNPNSDSYVNDNPLAIRAVKGSLLLYCFGPPPVIVTDRLRSYGAAMKIVGNAHRQETSRGLNNRAENSHPLPGSGLFANQEKGPFRRQERAMQRFRSMRTLQKFVSVHASVHNYVIDS